jgi:hypothetical protein
MVMSQLRLLYFSTNCIFHTYTEKLENKFQENPPIFKEVFQCGWTKRGTNKMKLTVAYHSFDDNLKNSLEI